MHQILILLSGLDCMTQIMQELAFEVENFSEIFLAIIFLLGIVSLLSVLGKNTFLLYIQLVILNGTCDSFPVKLNSHSFKRI